MNVREFQFYRLGLTMSVAILVGAAVASENTILAVVAVGAGLLLMYVGKKRVKGIIEDERTYRISEKASRITLALCGPAVALVATLLITMGDRFAPGLRTAGFALGYAACAVTVCYSTLYHCYQKKS